MARFIAPRTGAEETTLAEGQAEYCPITVAHYQDSELKTEILLARVTFSPAERELISAGSDLFIGQLTFGRAFTPLQITVGMTYWRLPNTEEDL